jgi:hypothetical protein
MENETATKWRVDDCDVMRIKYKSNADFQLWLLAHIGATEFRNRETGVKGAINLWQVSKLFPDELVPGTGPNDLLCNILEMVKKGWLEELHDPIISTDNDSRRFSMTQQGMVHFRQEIHPIAEMLAKEEQKLEEKIQNATVDSEVKKRVISELQEFGQKFKDRLPSQAADYVINIIFKVGVSSIPLLFALKC